MKEKPDTEGAGAAATATATAAAAVAATDVDRFPAPLEVSGLVKLTTTAAATAAAYHCLCQKFGKLE